jgi:ribosomal protein L16 Arg81 hydroxylase
MPLLFKDLVGDEADFFAEYFNRAPMLRKGAVADPSSLFSIADADEILNNGPVRPPHLRISKDGADVPAPRFTLLPQTQGITVTERVDPGRVYELFRSGATVSWNFLDRHDRRIRELVEVIADTFAARADATAMLTPARQKGFEVHHDGVDVYAVQLEGTKRWRVWQRGGAGRSYDFEVGSLGDPVLDVSLSPGDVLYVPYNSPHAVLAEDQVSLHVSIIVHPRRWEDLIRSTIDRLLGDEEFAEFPHLDRARNATACDAFAERITLLMQKLSSVDVETEINELIRTGRPQAKNAGSRVFQTAAAIETISCSTRMQRTPLPIAFAASEDQVEATINGRKILMPRHIADSLRKLSHPEEAAAGSLFPGVEENRSIRIARDFARLGVLAIVD